MCKSAEAFIPRDVPQLCSLVHTSTEQEVVLAPAEIKDVERVATKLAHRRASEDWEVVFRRRVSGTLSLLAADRPIRLTAFTVQRRPHAGHFHLCLTRLLRR